MKATCVKTSTSWWKQNLRSMCWTCCQLRLGWISALKWRKCLNLIRHLLRLHLWRNLEALIWLAMLILKTLSSLLRALVSPRWCQNPSWSKWLTTQTQLNSWKTMRKARRMKRKKRDWLLWRRRGRSCGTERRRSADARPMTIWYLSGNRRAWARTIRLYLLLGTSSKSSKRRISSWLRASSCADRCSTSWETLGKSRESTSLLSRTLMLSLSPARLTTR